MSEAPDANHMLKVYFHATFDVAVEVKFWFQLVMLQTITNKHCSK